jgi:hypothetical protein
MSDRFLDGFGPDELALHNVVMKDRNEVLAHSDSTAWVSTLLASKPRESCSKLRSQMPLGTL